MTKLYSQVHHSIIYVMIKRTQAKYLKREAYNYISYMYIYNITIKSTYYVIYKN